MPWYPFSRSSVGITLEDALAITNEHLENARNAQEANNPTKALYLCRSANDAIKDAKKIFSNKRGGDKRDDGIANAYHKRGEILEKLGQHNEAQKSYRKAKKWGYIEVAVFHTDPTLSSNSDNPIHLCPSSELLVTQDTTSSDVMDLIPVSIKDSAQAPQKIFGENIPPPVTTIDLPELGGRITGTSQLAYCLSLLNHSMVSKEELSGPESDWLLAASNDPDEQQRLQTLTTDVIRAFIRDELKGPDAVAETMTLAPVLEQGDFRKLLGVFVDGIEQSLLLEIHLLDGLAFLMKNAPPGSLGPDDLVKILELLRTRLKGTHQQSTEHTYQLVQTVSRVLDSMVDSQVEGIDRESLHEPLSLYLEKLKQSSDPRLVYQAAYAYQALQYIPDNETILQSMLRRTEKVVQGVSGVVSAVKALDINGFIDGLQHIQGGLEGVEKTISDIKDAYSNVKTLAENGQEFLESLKEGLSFTHRCAWYPALRGLDALWQEGRFAEFEKLIYEAPCRANPAFQWGVSYRLGELASKAWDTNTRQCAISFLGEMYTDDARWGQQANT
ncbi:hypothetical protein BGX21_011249 [Mortierella sp. AD011]|nr:hypothetical protein BGX21_011249 [Mortierella sp. AD011]